MSDAEGNGVPAARRQSRGGGPSASREARSSGRPAERSRRADPARLAAYTLLRAVSDGAYANLELPKILRDKRIRGRDAAFATELAYGAIRMRGLYDPIVEHAAGRPLAMINGDVLDTLRLGVHQLLSMRVPSHAAVDSSVALARQVNGIGASGFVNAVLRKVAGASREAWVGVVVAGREPLQRMSIEESHPEWVVKALRAALLGHDAATATSIDDELRMLLAADNVPARVTLVARPGLIDTRELLRSAQRAGGDDDSARFGQLAPTAVVLESGDPGTLPEIRDARAAVQDEGSQLVALALAGIPMSGDATGRWLDLCAGPGGKAGLLAARAVQEGASLLANEISPHRAELVRSALAAICERWPEAVEVRVGDGRDVGADLPESFDRVLVDAPCSGLGALRRRPEARWRRTPGDVVDLSRLQRELLDSAIAATRPGGVVAYAACSPHLNETRFAVQDVVKRRDDVEVIDARPAFEAASRGRLTLLGHGPYVQLWPHRHGTDAMFCAMLRHR